MWYFAWLLGLPLAAVFAVMNGIWYELRSEDAQQRKAALAAARAQGAMR